MNENSNCASWFRGLGALGLAAFAVCTMSGAEEGWILEEVKTTPENGRVAKEWGGFGLDWRTKRDVEVSRKDGKARIAIKRDYVTGPNKAVVGRYFGTAEFDEPPRVLVPGKPFQVTGRGQFKIEKRFAGHHKYYTGPILKVDALGGRTKLYFSKEFSDRGGKNTLELTGETPQGELVVEFNPPEPTRARESLNFRPGREKVEPELRITAKAGFDNPPGFSVSWIYRPGPIEDTQVVDLTALDGNPFLHGEEGETIRPSVLIRSELRRKGTVADGTSELVLRAEVSGSKPVVFQLVDDSRGRLVPLFEGKTLTLEEKYYAFARYVPPEAFEREGVEAPQSTMTEPKRRAGGPEGPESEPLNVLAVPYVPGPDGKMQPGRQGMKKLELELARPPVVLVHGLFSDPVTCWVGRLGEGKSLAVMLERAGFVPFLVNYARSNGYAGDVSWLRATHRRPSDFASNRNVVWESPDEDWSVETEARWLRGENDGWLHVEKQLILSDWQKPAELRLGGIKAALVHYRSQLGLACTQADVVGHSMGGVLSRVYASPDNPDYKRPENFGKGDINRLVTLNTPHFGSELAELTEILEPGRIGNESVPAWAMRFVASTLVRGFIGSTESGAIADLRPGSEREPLKRIGPTEIPSFAIATWVDHGKFGDEGHDPGGSYLMGYSGIGMLFFHNPGLLEAAIDRRAGEWAQDPGLRQDRASDAGGRGPAEAADFSSKAGIEGYKSRLLAGMNENVYYWTTYREKEYRQKLQRQIDGTALVPFGIFDGEQALGSVSGEFKEMSGKLILAGDVSKEKSARVQPLVPEGMVDAIRSLIFHGDSENDGAVRGVSQRGGLPKKATATFEGVVHSYSPWDGKVQREVVRLLRWGNARFLPKGFPAAARAMPRYLPTAAFGESRLDGPLAVAWAGMVHSHAEQYLAVADQANAVIIVRPVNQDSTPLIASGAATKGMAIKGKSSNWGPQRGLIAVEQRYSKIWRTKKDPERDADIKKYNAVNRKVLGGDGKEPLKYPEDEENMELKDRPFGVERALVVVAGGKDCEVLLDSQRSDAENEVFLYTGGKLYDWRTGTRKQGGVQVPAFDRSVAPDKEITGEKAQRVLARKLPMMVMADGLSDVRPHPYLTADYDLLAIGFHRPDGFQGVPEDVESANFHELRGFISGRQMELLGKLNGAVRDNAGYQAGNVSHHGPEVQYADSPYVDYPLLVLDPGGPGQGDGEMFIIRQGPVGFRDIHLKRYFGKRIGDRFNLWPNPDSDGWLWGEYSPVGGYDPRDAPGLLTYVAEQSRPEGFGGGAEAPAAPPESPPGTDDPEPMAAGTGPEPGAGDPADPPALSGFERLLRAAEAGDADAQNDVGKAYFSGDGVEKNPGKALEWFRWSAKNGSVHGQYNLAAHYTLGIVVEKDPAEGFKWYLKAARGGFPKAEGEVGYMLYNGIGCQRNDAYAVGWAKRAAAGGDPAGMNNLGAALQEGRGIEKNPATAHQWWTKAAKLGHAVAQRNLADQYVSGVGAQRSLIEAWAWYEIAAANGDGDAARKRGELALKLDSTQVKRARTRVLELRVGMERAK